MKSIKHLFIIILLLGFTSGCAYLQIPYNTNKPSLSLVDIKLKKANLFEQIFTAELTIENPNDFDLPVDDVEIELELEDHQLGEGITSQDFVVPANGEATFKMKIHTNLFSNLMILKKIVDSKPETIHYRLTGSVDVDLPLFLRDVHFETTDAIPAPNFKL
jgi:LEA14-like dessication related protein